MRPKDEFPKGYQVSTILRLFEKAVQDKDDNARKKAVKELQKTMLSCLDDPWLCCDHTGYRQGYNFARYSIHGNIKRVFGLKA